MYLELFECKYYKKNCGLPSIDGMVSPWQRSSSWYTTILDTESSFGTDFGYCNFTCFHTRGPKVQIWMYIVSVICTIKNFVVVFFDEPKAEFQKCYPSVLPLSYYRKFIIFYAKDDKWWKVDTIYIFHLIFTCLIHFFSLHWLFDYFQLCFIRFGDHSLPMFFNQIWSSCLWFPRLKRLEGTNAWNSRDKLQWIHHMFRQSTLSTLFLLIYICSTLPCRHAAVSEALSYHWL